MCDYFFIIMPSNQTCDGGVRPLQGVKLLVMWKWPVPVAPAYCPVPPATRKGTPWAFEAAQMAGFGARTKRSPSIKTESPEPAYVSVAFRSKTSLVVVFVHAEKTAVLKPPSVSIPEPVKLNSTFSGNAPQRATFGAAPARLNDEPP